LIFLGGASVAIGGSFLAEATKERVKHKKANLLTRSARFLWQPAKPMTPTRVQK